MVRGMIGLLRGQLERLEGGKALVFVPAGGGESGPVGLGYEVLLPAFVADELAPRIGERVELHTICYHEAQSQGASFLPRLIGFVSPADRRFFELFTTVKGLGSRKALRALKQPTGRVAGAIADRDGAFLQTLPEIGKRLAETIVAELHGKVDDFARGPGGADGAGGAGGAVEAEAGDAAGGAEAERAVEAMVRLGESRADAVSLVRRAVGAQPELRSADEILSAAFAQRR